MADEPSNKTKDAVTADVKGSEATVNPANRRQRVYGSLLTGETEHEDIAPPPPPPGSYSGPPSLLGAAQAQPDPLPSGGGFGSGGYGRSGFGGGAFNTGAFNTQVFNEGPVVEPKHAPEPVRQSSIIGSGIGGGVYGPGPVVLDKTAAILQIRGLIIALEEAVEYDPTRHHNSPPPALWVDSPEYVGDIKDLVRELRRLNDLLEAGKEPTSPVAQRVGAALVSGVEVIFKTACGTIGVGLGYVVLGSIIEVLSQLGLRNEINQILSWSSKLK